jgi:glycosyltransferase involved in cell wall biosynthesis
MKKPIKVMQFICPTGFYGAERWILALAKHLDPQQVLCDLAVSSEPTNQDLELTRQYKQLNLKTHEIPMRGKFDLSALSKLVKVLRDQEFDLIHTHGYKSDIIGLLAARKAGIPCVITPHGFSTHMDLKLRIFSWLGGRALRRATRVVPLSTQLMKDCKELGVPDNKMLYIQNGVDLSEVEAQEKPTREANAPKRVGFVGQLISRKNVFDLLAVFDALHAKHPATRLVILGDGDQRAELEAHAQTLPSKDSIEFLGFRNDRLELLKSFDLFAMTSTLEGIPRCLMEATAAEIPVAAYNIAGIDQLITHESTGLLAPLGDKQQLLQHWETMLFETEKARELATAAKKFVYENYSAQRMATEYTDLFKELTSKD